MSDNTHSVVRTPGSDPVVPSQAELAAREGWHEIFDELERDVSRAEKLAVGTRTINDEGTPETSGDTWTEDELSDEKLALLSVPLPDEPPWEPAPGHPPMPVVYAERARTLLDRQIAIAAHIAREISMGRQQAAYASHIEELEEVRATPAFIDEAI